MIEEFNVDSKAELCETHHFL